MSVRPFHLQRPLAAVAAAYGVGAGAGVCFSWRPGIYLAGLGVAALAAVLLRKSGRRAVMGAAAVALFLGMLLSGWASHPTLPEVGRYQAFATAAGDMALREDGTAAGYLENVRIQSEEGEYALRRVYWTYTPDDPDAPMLPREGDTVAFFGRLYHPQGQVNPYGFDFRMYLLQKGVSAGISGAADLEITGHAGRGLRSVTYQTRKWIAERMDLIFGEESALPKALLIGQRSELPQETARGFADAGCAHVLAVSGLHVALLAAVLMAPLRRLLSPRCRLWVLTGFLLGYCALLDFSAPVVRAAILLVIASARRIVRRVPDRLTALAAAFLLILLVRPLDLYSASFQLSFCAVLGIAMMIPWLEKRLPRWLETSVGVTLAATAGAAVPTVQIFHRLSLIGLLINPAVCLVFGWLIPLYLAVTVIGCVYLPAGAVLAAYVNRLSLWVTGTITWLGSLPFATVNVPSLPWYCVLALAAAALLATRYTVWPGKRKAAAAAAALVAAFGTWGLTACRDVQYIQLAVGQADCAMILDGPETVVIDAGEYGGDAASYLLATGRRADVLILTHLHMDHCGGVEQLLRERVPVGTVYLPEGAEEQQIDDKALALLRALEDQGAAIRHVAAGDEIRTERTVLTVLWPQTGRVRPGQDANRYAMGLLCDLDGVKLLSCSDIPGDYEMYAARDADILKVAHHGSKNSTGQAFLSAVTPSFSVVTNGPGSALLPHPDTLERLRQAGSGVYLTARTGAITVTARRGEAKIKAYLPIEEQK